MALEYQKAIQPIHRRLEYDVNKNPIYIGQSARGTATSGSGWTITKYSYDGANNVTSWATALGAWDDRASLTYS